MNTTIKRALVTGGSGGIGAAICRRLARDGHYVYVHAHRGVTVADALVKDIVAAGGHAQTLCFDVTDANATHLALETILNDGPIQILVNNAGIHDDAVLPGMSAEQWHRVIDVSVIDFFNIPQPFKLQKLLTDTSMTRCHCSALIPGSTASS